MSKYLLNFQFSTIFFLSVYLQNGLEFVIFTAEFMILSFILDPDPTKKVLIRLDPDEQYTVCNSSLFYVYGTWLKTARFCWPACFFMADTVK